MKQLRCKSCGKDFPMNKTFTVFDTIVCEPCGQAEVARRNLPQIPKGAVRRNLDSTVCSKCGADNSPRDLDQVAGRPLCPSCAAAFRKYPFPAWVKLAFLAMFLLTGAEMVRNARLFQAYFEFRGIEKATKAGNLEKASALATAAAGHVPESKFLYGQAKFLEGIKLMQLQRPSEALPLLYQSRATASGQDQEAIDRMIGIAQVEELLAQDKSAEALASIAQLRRSYGDDHTLEALQRSAEIGAAFDSKDYDKFLTLARRDADQDPGSTTAWAQVASAFACKYAVTGQETYKSEAMKYLAKARELAGEAMADFKEYEARILYRLQTREIINKAEYDRRLRLMAGKGQSK